MRRWMVLACLLLAVAPWAAAQDAVEVDPDHYQVVFENEEVRVLRITYGPREKSAMHEHPDSVAIFLTDLKGRFTLPDGSTEDIEAKAGDAVWTPAGQHLPENLTDQPFELIQVELKNGGDGGSE